MDITRRRFDSISLRLAASSPSSFRRASSRSSPGVSRRPSPIWRTYSLSGSAVCGSVTSTSASSSSSTGSGTTSRRASGSGAGCASGSAIEIHKQRSGASALLDQVAVPEDVTEALVHVRDYTKGHPRIEANNHPIRHGAVVGVHNGIIFNDDELMTAHGFERAEPN